jgi:hypothetical protein
MVLIAVTTKSIISLDVTLIVLYKFTNVLKEHTASLNKLD